MAAQDYLNKYNELFKQSQAYDVNAFTNELERQYNERQNYNRDLIEQQNALQQQSLALPAQLRQEYADSPIRNALAQEAIIASRRAGVGQQLGSVTDLLNARGQQFENILGRAVGGYQTAAQRAQTAAENAWRLYQDQLAQEEARRARAAAAAMYGGFGAGGGAGGMGESGQPEELVIETSTKKAPGQQVQSAMERLKVATGRPVGTGNWLQRNVVDPLGVLIQAPTATLTEGFQEALRRYTQAGDRNRTNLLNLFKRK